MACIFASQRDQSIQALGIRVLKSAPHSPTMNVICEHAQLSASERDHAVDDFIALVAAVDRILQAQSKSDASYFIRRIGRAVTAEDSTGIEAIVLAAYRWQYHKLQERGGSSGPPDYSFSE